MGGRAGKIIGGALITLGGIAVGYFSGNWTLGLVISSRGLGMMWSGIKGGENTEALTSRQGRILKNRTGSKVPIPVVYGQARVGAVLTDIRIDENSYNNKRLVMVCAFTHGSDDGTGIEAIDEIYLDDNLAWTYSGGVQAPYSVLIDDPDDAYQTEHLEVTTYLGTDSQNVDSDLAAIFPSEWPSTSRGRGIAYVVLKLWYNETYFPGIPRVNAVVRGQKVFDPRYSTTVYSDNPALAVRDFLTADIYGYGIADALMDDTDTFENEADYCDELVTPYSGSGTQKRFEIGGALNTGRAIRASLADLNTSCRGTVLNTGGYWKLRIRKEQSATGLEITPDNTVEGTWKYILPGSSQTPNSIMVHYVDENRDYQVDSVRWPEAGGTNPYLNDDAGYEREVRFDLPFTTNRLRAQQIGMIMLREAREGIGVVVTGKQELIPLEFGDIVNVTQPGPGWSSKPFWVMATNYRPTEQVIDLILVEYDSSVYTYDEQFPQPDIEDTVLPEHKWPPEIISIVPTVAGNGDVTVTLTTRNAGSVKIVGQSGSWPTAYDVQAESALATDADGTVVTPVLCTLNAGQKAYIAAYAYENADGTGREADQLAKVQTTETTTEQQTTLIYDGFSESRDASAPEAGNLVIGADGEEGFCHLEDANDAETTYQVWYDVDCTGMGKRLLYVEVYYSTAAVGGSWVLASSRVYDETIDLIDEMQSFSAALDAGYDIRVVLNYSGSGSDATVTLHGETHSTRPGVRYERVDGSVLSEEKGGTAQSTYDLGDVLYSSATDTLARLSGNDLAEKRFLVQTGTGSESAAPVWGTIAWSDVSKTGADLEEIVQPNEQGDLIYAIDGSAWAVGPSKVGISDGDVLAWDYALGLPEWRTMATGSHDINGAEHTGLPLEAAGGGTGMTTAPDGSLIYFDSIASPSGWQDLYIDLGEVLIGTSGNPESGKVTSAHVDSSVSVSGHTHAASDITTGLPWDKSDLPSTVAYTDEANVFADKQVFQVAGDQIELRESAGNQYHFTFEYEDSTETLYGHFWDNAATPGPRGGFSFDTNGTLVDLAVDTVNSQTVSSSTILSVTQKTELTGGTWIDYYVMYYDGTNLTSWEDMNNIPLLDAANVFTVDQTIEDAHLTLNRTSTSNYEFVEFMNSGVARWRLGIENDAGGDWLLWRYNDAGVLQDVPISVDRAAGGVNLLDTQIQNLTLTNELGIAYGGTGQTSFSSGFLIYFNGTELDSWADATALARTDQDETFGGYTYTSDLIHRVVVEATYDVTIRWGEESDAYGFSWFYDGNSTNDLFLRAHASDATGLNVLRVDRATEDVQFYEDIYVDGTVYVGDGTSVGTIILQEPSVGNPEVRIHGRGNYAEFAAYVRDNTEVYTLATNYAQFRVRMYDSTGTAQDAAVLRVTAENSWTSAANEDVYMSFHTRIDGALAERWRIDINGNWVPVNSTNSLGTTTYPLGTCVWATDAEFWDDGGTVIATIGSDRLTIDAGLLLVDGSFNSAVPAGSNGMSESGGSMFIAGRSSINIRADNDAASPTGIIRLQAGSGPTQIAWFQVGQVEFYDNLRIAHTTGGEMLVLRDTGGTTADNSECYIRFEYSTGTDLGYIGFWSTSNDDLYLVGETGDIRFYAQGSGTYTCYITSTAIVPGTSGNDLGSGSNRWELYATVIDTTGNVGIGGTLTVTGNAKFDEQVTGASYNITNTTATSETLTVDWDNGNTQVWTLGTGAGGTKTFDIDNDNERGGTLILFIDNDSGGSRLIAFSGVTVWASGTPPTSIDDGDSLMCVLTTVYNGTYDRIVGSWVEMTTPF